MKKITALAMTLVLVVALFAGCDSKDKDVLKIGLVQLMEHPSLDTIRESIIEGLADEGYVDGCFLWCVPAHIRAAGGHG